MTNPQDTIARLLCNDAAARKIAHEEAAPCFDESAAVVQEYWRALAAALSVPNHSSVGLADVIQADRDAAADQIERALTVKGQDKPANCVFEQTDEIRAGNADDNDLVQAFSRHRIAFALLPTVPAGVSEDEIVHLRQTVEYLTGVPPQLGVINDFRAPEVDQAILRCRERGDDDTANVLAQMRLVYRRQNNELQTALAALASPSSDTPEIEGRGQ